MLYLSEHKTCRNYQKDGRPSIEYKRISKGERMESVFMENKIVFMLEGLLSVVCGNFDNQLKKGYMLVVPGGTPYAVDVLEDACYIICRVKNNLHLCEEFSLEKLFREEDLPGEIFRPLPFCEGMWLYIRTLTNYLNDDIRCLYLFELKIKELLFLLRNYYTKEQLREFFSPLLTNDLRFSDFILKSHRQVRNVKEFAELANYSISGFEKRFKKVFHVSAYRWMKEQKAKDILHEIHNSDKTFKEIGWDYGFASPAQFNDFCKSYFGMTPGQIRSAATKEEKE